MSTNQPGHPLKPTLSAPGTTQLQAYATALASHADLSPITVRNYLSDLQQFATWCEATWAEDAEQAVGFMPAQLTISTPSSCAPPRSTAAS